MSDYKELCDLVSFLGGAVSFGINKHTAYFQFEEIAKGFSSWCWDHGFQNRGCEKDRDMMGKNCFSVTFS